jgi:diadenosine tetraphosphate (Ap4A) HIT family hydrolase
MKIFESDKTLAFLDISPLSKGHSVRPSLVLSAALGHITFPQVQTGMLTQYA